MLRALKEDQKHQWKDHLNNLMFAYNSTVHKTTGYSPFFLCYGRESRIPLDCILPIETNKTTRKTYDRFVKDWKSSMKDAFQVVSQQVEKAGAANKRRYDKTMNAVPISIGDRVLVRNLVERGGTGKLRSWWEQKFYEVVDIHDLVPVYTVRPLEGGETKTLHRNMIMQVNKMPLDTFEQVPANDSGAEAEPQAAPEVARETAREAARETPAPRRKLRKTRARLNRESALAKARAKSAETESDSDVDIVVLGPEAEGVETQPSVPADVTMPPLESESDVDVDMELLSDPGLVEFDDADNSANEELENPIIISPSSTDEVVEIEPVNAQSEVPVEIELDTTREPQFESEPGTRTEDLIGSEPVDPVGDVSLGEGGQSSINPPSRRNTERLEDLDTVASGENSEQEILNRDEDSEFFLPVSDSNEVRHSSPKQSETANDSLETLGEGSQNENGRNENNDEGAVTVVQSESMSSVEQTFLGFESGNETIIEVGPDTSGNIPEGRNSDLEVNPESEAQGSSDYVTADEEPSNLSQSGTGSSSEAPTQRKSNRVRKMKKILTYESDFQPRIKRYGSVGLYCISLAH